MTQNVDKGPDATLRIIRSGKMLGFDSAAASSRSEPLGDSINLFVTPNFLTQKRPARLRQRFRRFSSNFSTLFPFHKPNQIAYAKPGLDRIAW